MRAIFTLLGMLAALLAGCIMPETESNLPGEPSRPLIVRIPSATPPPAPTVPAAEASRPWTDESAVMHGICFEAAADAAGQITILRSAEDHIRFYDMADNAGLCRHAVTRHPFDFSQGYVLAGLWSRGWGCTARHAVTDFQRDDATRTITAQIQFFTEGDCPYELVRPFWMGIPNATDYDITLVVD